MFELIFSELSVSDSAELPDAPEPEVLVIDATDIEAHPTASSLNKGGDPRLMGGTVNQLSTWSPMIRVTPA